MYDFVKNILFGRPTVTRLPVDHFTASGSSVSLLFGLGPRGECILFSVGFVGPKKKTIVCLLVINYLWFRVYFLFFSYKSYTILFKCSIYAHFKDIFSPLSTVRYSFQGAMTMCLRTKFLG